MSYTLCSSSEEEPGEITQKTTTQIINTNMLFTNTLFHKNYFIGANKKLTKDRFSYTENKLECVKNRLKKAVPFNHVLSFARLNAEKAQSLKFLGQVAICSVPLSFESINNRVAMSNTLKFVHSSEFYAPYKSFCEYLLDAGFKKDTVVISDYLLNCIGTHSVRFKVVDVNMKENALVKTVSDFLMKKKTAKRSEQNGGVKLIVFEDVVGNRELNTTIELYGQAILSNTKTIEVNAYDSKKKAMLVFSSSVIKDTNGNELRTYSSVDKCKSASVLVCMDFVKMVPDYEPSLRVKNKKVLDLIVSIDLGVGSYVLKEESVYEVESIDEMSINEGISLF